ncbi:MAG: hypothetical protein P0Y53_09560 [Candidatus Pseudobacter hemicellulosilyticus]|uniref:Beta-carotene 15,15'-monooxygenase n=1 Tax=Candidatus Pseudobacter hemicellulosilyticus TaxID=3121375 RepID=A0AAJ5WWA2_9BACT|nr:MAG: hypothetical protein P0Y53_09560 [Pseudobacter sp.]
MIGTFKQKNSGNTLVLLVYGLVLKFNIFLHPLPPRPQPDDHYLYTWLLGFLSPFNGWPVFFSFIAFLLLYSQALLLNRICNAQKMMSRPSYLVAMAYMLLTSLMADWNYFSAPLLINSLLIWIFYRFNVLYNSPKPGTVIFNIGLIMGIVTLLYQPACVFVLFLLLGLFIIRPLRVREWLIGLVGVTVPYYFLGLLLYLTNHWEWQRLAPQIEFRLPPMPSSLFVSISLFLLILPFIVGGYFVQNNLSKMFIQVRKSWSLLLVCLVTATLVIVVNGDATYGNWLLCVAPLAVFHGAAYFYPTGKWFPRILHWLIFGYAMYLNYWL